MATAARGSVEKAGGGEDDGARKAVRPPPNHDRVNPFHGEMMGQSDTLPKIF